MRRDSAGLVLAVLCCTAAVGTGTSTSLRNLLQGQEIIKLESANNVTHLEKHSGFESLVEGNLQSLELCECEPATGAPDSLSCEKEGWFISNFQQAGQWTIPGSEGDTAVAIISAGCHPSSNAGAGSLRCEPQGGSFVSGWAEALRIPDARRFFYPVGAVQCCTPSLLLASGNARLLQRCDCVEQNDINCGGTSSHRLLSGYSRWGISQINNFVPIAPALCCKSCISDTVIPADSCFDLNYCSGHGACNLGSCECHDGYGGADCSHRVSVDPGGLPQWAIMLIILGSVTVSLVLLMIVVRIGRYCAEEHAEGEEEGEEGDEELREPLIAGLESGDEGSVGSEDSSDYNTDDDQMPPPLSRRRDTAEQAVGGGVPVTPEEQAQDTETDPESEALRTVPFEISQGNAEERQDENETQAPSEEELNSERVRADQAVIEGIRQAEARDGASRETESDSLEAEKERSAGAKSKEEKDRGGIPGVICSVCFNRPVQVAAVPCGHMCMCRRCSRRLQTCPVCRTKILRRQRVFIGG